MVWYILCRKKPVTLFLLHLFVLSSYLHRACAIHALAAPYNVHVERFRWQNKNAPKFYKFMEFGRGRKGGDKASKYDCLVTFSSKLVIIWRLTLKW